jgi:diadenosine tetraphosphatase ApaH/serine/threonine PP2A family protein phosphatase
MRVLVITDIHANLVALEAVLEKAGEVDAVWCLGDVVGYGPNPNECIELIKEQPNLICLLGNHDAAAIGMLDVSTFNPEARLSVEWTQDELTAENKAFLDDRPMTHIEGAVTLAHGSPRHPVYEYLLDTRAATENFEHFQNDFCFVGHTHLPVLFYMENEDYMARLTIPAIDETTQLTPRSIINPGSVGQPRDRDPRAAFAIYNTETNEWDYSRVDYDIEATQKRMMEHELPERHVMRLTSGW